MPHKGASFRRGELYVGIAWNLRVMIYTSGQCAISRTAPYVALVIRDRPTEREGLHWTALAIGRRSPPSPVSYI